MSSSLVPNEGQRVVERRTWMPAYALTLQVLAAVFVGLRLITRVTRNGPSWGWDDLFIVLAFVFGVALTALVLLSTYTAGFDRHIWDVPFTLWGRGALFARLIEMFFLLASCANKVSVLLFYRRVVQGTCTKIYKLSVWAALIFCVLYTVIFSITLWAMCTPVKATYLRYDPTFKEPFHCWSQPTEAWTSQLAGALSVFSDFYALMLPGFLLFQLQIPRQQKIALYCVFSLGFSVVAAGVVRTIYLGKSFDGKSLDLSWIGFSAYVASLAEIQLGIICACAPSLKAVFHKFFQQALPAIGTVLSSRGSGSRRIMRKKSRKFDESIDSTQINLTGHPGGGEDNLGHHTMIVATQVPHSRPKTALSEVKAKMKKWPKRTPEIHETTSFSMAHEDAVVPSDRGGPSPIPEGYQFTRPAASVLSPSRPASDHSFATFHRWEKGDHEKPLPSTPPDTLSEHSADRETIWVGRAV